MSDYSDILYDPALHTHTSCLKELPNCDAVVVVIGSRFGGRAVPEAVSHLEVATLPAENHSEWIKENKANISITQMEVIKAIQLGMPIYVFVDQLVYSDHHLYEANKGSQVIDQIKFPSIENPKTAKYIFEFINFLRLRSKNNSLFSFTRPEEIDTTLKKQWAALFQRLLQGERERASEARRIDHMAEQFESLKTAIINSLPTSDARTAARSVVKFRRLVDFLRSFPGWVQNDMELDCSFKDLLKKYRVVRLYGSEGRGLPRISADMADGTTYRFYLNARILPQLEVDWDQFKAIQADTKRVVVETSVEQGEPYDFEIIVPPPTVFSLDELIDSAPDDPT